MQWVLDNWIWILLGGGMIVMHLFGHGGHGGHGARGKGDNDASQTARNSEAQSPIDGNPGPNRRHRRSSQLGETRDL